MVTLHKYVLHLGFFEPAQQDWASLSQLEPAWAGKLNAVSWAWNSAQAGSIINFQIKLSSSWLNALSWRFSSAQAGSTFELGWVGLSQVELAQPGSSWIPQKRGKNDIFGKKMTFLVKKSDFFPKNSWNLDLAQAGSKKNSFSSIWLNYWAQDLPSSSWLNLWAGLSQLKLAQSGSTHLEPAQLSSAQKNQIGCQLSSTVEPGVKCQLKEPYLLSYCRFQ